MARHEARTRSYKAAGTITEVVEYEGARTSQAVADRLEEIADHALDWAVEQATAPATVSRTTTQ